jgi:hypothetical protein
VPTLPAHLVALPVLERLTGDRSGVVLGAGATACWVELDGFVAAVTTREVPLLPNAIAVAPRSGAGEGRPLRPRPPRQRQVPRRLAPPPDADGD